MEYPDGLIFDEIADSIYKIKKMIHNQQTLILIFQDILNIIIKMNHQLKLI
jgi:hypothetical protein